MLLLLRFNVLKYNVDGRFGVIVGGFNYDRRKIFKIY